METFVLGLVLLAALLHATWNAFVKANDDRLAGMTLIIVGTGLWSVPAAFFVPIPTTEVFAILGVSICVHLGYNIFLARSYDHGEMGQVYPIARGAAPLMVTVASLIFIGDALTTLEVSGILLLTLAVMSLALRGGAHLTSSMTPVYYALATAGFIAGYTILDGIGSRTAQSPHTYIVWVCMLNGATLLPVAYWMRGPSLWTEAKANWRTGVAGGLMALIAYWIVIWAFTQTSIAMVSAVRETSVVFAALIASVFLNERFTLWKFGATLAVLGGLLMLRL
jgi:drug/metabolite transporter (DMT)-like permease